MDRRQTAKMSTLKEKGSPFNCFYLGEEMGEFGKDTYLSFN